MTVSQLPCMTMQGSCCFYMQPSIFIFYPLSKIIPYNKKNHFFFVVQKKVCNIAHVCI